MKKVVKIIGIVAVMAIIGFSFAACSTTGNTGDDGAFTITTLPPLPKLQSITMTTTSTSVINITLHGSGTVVIDWGDASTTQTLNADTQFKHTYTAAGVKTVRVETEGIIDGLNCRNNNLASLDVSKNTALADLNFHTNNLDKTNMEAVYSVLRTNNAGAIRCDDNPGYIAANKTIATSQGWTFTE
ncbi:MAG: hypothetical protein LBL70_03940 [Treponema sp.]|nr:hypothetical protein [Treponema sp.]